MPSPAGTRCLDCAAVLYADEVGGGLVDQWGERTCSASYRDHAPDLPAVVGENMAGRLRRVSLVAGPPCRAGSTRQGPGRYQTRHPTQSRLRKILAERLRWKALRRQASCGPAWRGARQARYLATHGQAAKNTRQPARNPAPGEPAMPKRTVSNLDVPLFTDLPTTNTNHGALEETPAQRSVAFGRCPNHTSRSLTGIVRGGRHLYWRAHYVRTYGSYRLCTASEAPLCSVPVDRRGPPCPCGETRNHKSQQH